MKNAIEATYKTLFNFFVNKDGYGNLTHLLASAVTTLFLSMVILNIIALLSLFINSPLYTPFGKGGKILLVLFCIIAGYILLFSVFKFSKNGENGSLFSLDVETSKIVWIVILSNTAIFILLGFIRMYYFKS